GIDIFIYDVEGERLSLRILLAPSTLGFVRRTVVPQDVPIPFWRTPKYGIGAAEWACFQFEPSFLAPLVSFESAEFAFPFHGLPFQRGDIGDLGIAPPVRSIGSAHPKAER